MNVAYFYGKNKVQIAKFKTVCYKKSTLCKKLTITSKRRSFRRNKRNIILAIKIPDYYEKFKQAQIPQNFGNYVKSTE